MMRTVLAIGVLFGSVLFAGVDTTRWLRVPDGPDDVAGADIDEFEGVDAEPGSKLFGIMADMVPEDDYSLTEHFVTTSDGYILRMFRLQAHDDPTAGMGAEQQGSSMHASAAGADATRPVVMVQHALLDSSAGWVMAGPQSSLVFMLADAGFDVWMGNVRGNRFSRNHTTLDPDSQPEFWAYSFDHHAQQDLPAMVQVVLDVTRVTSIQYIGYSQGTMMVLGALSLQLPSFPPGAISLAVLLAPVAFTAHITSLPFIGATKISLAERLSSYGLTEFGGHNDHSAAVFSHYCALLPWACTKWLQLLCGANSNSRAPNGNVARELLPRIMQHLPAGTSVQNMMHWGQGVRSSGYQVPGPAMFDYGTTCVGPDGKQQPCNQRAYGSTKPPVYNLSAITTPLALFTGGQDSLSDPQDVLLLLDALAPGTVVHHTHIPEYAHLDFGLGTDASERLYPTVVQLLLGHIAQPQAKHEPPTHPHQEAASTGVAHETRGKIIAAASAAS